MTPMVPPNPKHDPKLVQVYEEHARKYYRSLPPEDTIDTVDQGVIRAATLASFSVIRARRPDIQCFNELLIRYPRIETDEMGRVVPNNFVLIHNELIQAGWSFDIPSQPARPVLAIDYITDYRNPESYANNFHCYERELKIAYYLRVQPTEKEFTLFRLVGGQYVVVPPNEAGRYPIPELELEVGWRERRVRYWFRGELALLPSELHKEIEAIKAELQVEVEKVARLAAERQAEVEKTARLAAEAELARLREELAKAKGQPG